MIILDPIDFGIASKVQDGKTQVTIENQMGTLNYISPETLNNPTQGTSSHKISFKSDVWSLGCILYNLVYKKLPFSHLKNTFEKIHVQGGAFYLPLWAPKSVAKKNEHVAKKRTHGKKNECRPRFKLIK